MASKPPKPGWWFVYWPSLRIRKTSVAHWTDHNGLWLCVPYAPPSPAGRYIPLRDPDTRCPNCLNCMSPLAVAVEELLRLPCR